MTDASGRPAPRVFFGTARLGSIDPTGWFDRRARRDAFRVLDAVAEAGCRGLDLARSYQAGATERVVGEWLAATRMRDRLFLVSKAGHPLPVLAPNRLGARSLEADLEATRKALRIDGLDMLLLHRDHPEADLTEVAKTLTGFRRDGRARSTGVSNWTFDRIQALDAAWEGDPVVQASSPQLSLAAWKAPPWSGCVTLSGRANRYERRRYRRAQLPTLAYCPLGRGFLSGGRGTRHAAPFRSRGNDHRRARCETLADERGVTPAQIALAYLSSQPFPVHPVVGTSSRTHMEANLRAASLILSEADRRWLETGGRRT